MRSRSSPASSSGPASTTWASRRPTMPTRRMLNFTDPAEQRGAARSSTELGKIQVPSRSSYFGIVDLCRLPEGSLLHLPGPLAARSADGAHPAALELARARRPVTPVHVYTSGDEAELFLNGRSLGRKKRGAVRLSPALERRDVRAGRAEGRRLPQGQKWAERPARTTGPPRSVLTVDRETIAADGHDLAFVTASIVDERGVARAPLEAPYPLHHRRPRRNRRHRQRRRHRPRTLPTAERTPSTASRSPSSGARRARRGPCGCERLRRPA